MQDRAHTLRSLTLFVSSHFMFNVLSKLQSEILAADKKEAIATLGDFSALLRKSNEIILMDALSLKDEAVFLNMYLKLERKRFGEKSFSYDIEGFDETHVRIEPFILQPFVELGVLGGLNRDGQKVQIKYLPATHEIQIESIMSNTKALEKVQEKCNIAKDRLEFFRHQYQINEAENRYLQKIILQK